MQYARDFEKSFVEYCKEKNINPSKYSIDEILVFDAHIQADQRRLSYFIYHKTEMNELKYVAVFCYWLIRFKPISRQQGGEIDINENFVLDCLLNATIKYKKGKYSGFVDFSENIKKELLYALTYRVSSDDELALYLELLAE